MVGEGVRWSADRAEAWRLIDGEEQGSIALDEARAIASVVPPQRPPGGLSRLLAAEPRGRGASDPAQDAGPSELAGEPAPRNSAPVYASARHPRRHVAIKEESMSGRDSAASASSI